MPEINLEDWKTHTTVLYRGGEKASKSERVLINNFWEALSSSSEFQRSRLLQFVTGSSRVPIEGFKVANMPLRSMISA